MRCDERCARHRDSPEPMICQCGLQHSVIGMRQHDRQRPDARCEEKIASSPATR